ncbi:Zinc finger, RING-type [Corchorus capsularis]|uniref:RING-type E3 ubiquitin transferase n=1 Tax=Corchorus capsularis TaxID=210143 RepID=A0A1R3IK91_COCAP|nr:Zinc finger, RING-type [Corchorus capsularis]
MSSSSYYECEAWQVEDCEEDIDLIEEDSSNICPVFSIEIFANIISDEQTFMQQVLVPQGQLTQGTSWSAISSKLSQMHVPLSLHATVTHKIIDCARSAMIEAHNKNRNNIPIIVTVRLIIDEEEEVVVEDVRPRGASKEAIDALDKVEDGEFTGPCVICLEEIWDGIKLPRRMPCSHVYHQACIVSWLENSNFCPLCRFQMPV